MPGDRIFDWQHILYFMANKPIFWTYSCDLIFWGLLIGLI